MSTRPHEPRPQEQGPEPADRDAKPAVTGEPGDGRTRAGVRKAVIGLFAAAAVFAYALDQLSKFWVSTTMEEGERIAVLPPVLHWYYIRNSGAAFSIGENFTWVFTIIMACVSIAVLVFIRRVGSLWWGLALGFLLGGALGNLTDRLFRPPSFGMGHVVDFIQLPNFAIFNIADSAVVCAVSIIVILTLRGIGADGRRLSSAKSDDDAEGDRS
ncbi:signal peptidase II [Arthrobacter woluwensis]|uniref:signal peptidase II n=1 Tax=Arthrobacter woluwensis TaxID=156980 RepID=UPI002787EE81|nr:signal peptidase II [Arthrobacter woluwensis]MDQ0708489.1 signal peptidase II [Arthrobacter woluwensis]